MSKKRKHLRNPRISDATIFVRYACEILRAYRDDPIYIPSKGDLEKFYKLRQIMESANSFSVQMHERMKGRIEGHSTNENR